MVPLKVERNASEGEQELHKCCRKDFTPLAIQLLWHGQKMHHSFVEDGLVLAVICRRAFSYGLRSTAPLKDGQDEVSSEASVFQREEVELAKHETEISQ